MMANRTIGLALGLIAGIILATVTGWIIHPVILLIIGIIGLGTLIYEYRQERKWHEWPAYAVFAAAFICAMPLGHWRTTMILGQPADHTLRSTLMQMDDKTAISVRGKICHEPELRKEGQIDIQLRVSQIRNDDAEKPHWQDIKSGKLLVRIYAQKSSTDDAKEKLNLLASPESYGYSIELSSRYNPITAALNPGEFDYGKFLQSGGLATRLRAHINRVKIIEKTYGNPLTEIALIAKEDFIKTYKQTISAPASLLVSAATLGTRRVVENVNYRGLDIAKTFRHAGVGHVLAVSGIHVSVVTILLFTLFRMTGVRTKVFVPPLILFLILFALLTGARPSSLRAVIMNSVVLMTLAYFPCGLRRATAMGLAVSSFLILIVNPTVLFAPSFLLSYGAVISLILISPPMDRWLCTFRGFSLFFLLAWFVLIIAIAAQRFYLLINPWNMLGLFGLLWLLKIGGNRLNHRYPKVWRFGLERLPAPLRLFLGAQLAIQIGMMIPMSSWFFGQFPVAGILVNLLAIPMVALVVQIGMLTGLIGLIPFIGVYLALPFGAAATVIANAFFMVANAGAVVFPFPATPRPTLSWLGAYYAIVAAILIFDLFRIQILSLLYRYYPSKGAGRIVVRMLWILPFILLAMPLMNHISKRPDCTGIQCLASGRHPIITMSSSDGSAVVINAGAGLTGERLLFDALRSQGPSRVETVILCSVDPRVGIEGCTTLMNKMRIEKCMLSVLPTAGRSYIEAINDEYLTRQVAEGQRWVKNYEETFGLLQKKLTQNKVKTTAIQSETPLATWKNGSISSLPRYSGKPKRFAASARTPILEACINGLKWLIITDTSYDAVKQIITKDKHYDVVVVPDLSSRKSYSWWIKNILRNTAPSLLIITGEKESQEIDMETWTEKIDTEHLTVYMTATDGAISASFGENKTTNFKTHLTNKTLTLFGACL